MSYVEAVEILPSLLHLSSKEGDGMLHLTFIHVMIPWYLAYDKLNYVLYLPDCYA